SQVIDAAYPSGDRGVMGGVLSLLWRGGRADAATRSALLILLSGLALFVTADLIYAYTAIMGTYAGGGWVDIGWVIAYLLFGFAALRQPYTRAPADSGRRSARLLDRLSILLPFAAIAFGYGLMILIASGGFTTGPRLQGLFVGAGLLTAFVLGRQMIALRENARLNAELRALSSDLERRVVQRTLQLQDTQQALFVSQKLASVGTLAAGVVHEVSNPLNTILAAAESLEMKIGGGIGPDELNKTLTLYLPIITRAGEQAARIVQALRTYSRGSAPELAPQDLSEVLQDALLL
ncbi:MAG: histidine kinase dimerization/phospho-acceptor domain-containing protein, partial [Chloroflexota bacterium]